MRLAPFRCGMASTPEPRSRRSRHSQHVDSPACPPPEGATADVCIPQHTRVGDDDPSEQLGTAGVSLPVLHYVESNPDADVHATLSTVVHCAARGRRGYDETVERRKVGIHMSAPFVPHSRVACERGETHEHHRPRDPPRVGECQWQGKQPDADEHGHGVEQL